MPVFKDNVRYFSIILINKYRLVCIVCMGGGGGGVNVVWWVLIKVAWLVAFINVGEGKL